MKIHTVTQGETLSSIAEKYGIYEKDLSGINGISDGKIAVGEELLILIPTRVHTARQGDSVERLCLRYRVRKNDVLAFNPTLCDGRLESGERIALKYDEKAMGMAVANGYVYKGTSYEALERALPYMTYATFVSASADERGLHKIFDEENLLKRVIQENKIPLLKIHDNHKKRFENGSLKDKFSEEIIDAAKSHGYKGIVLNSCAFSDSSESYSAFLMNLKKQMIGSDLILITECDEKVPSVFCDLADGSVFSYSKLWDKIDGKFDECERKAIADFACDAESVKSFIELPSFARYDDGFVDIESAKSIARKGKVTVESNLDTGLSCFSSGRKNYIYPSLSNIKAVLELLSEYGYMGISFDVSRTPRVFLMMYNAMYKTVCAAL